MSITYLDEENKGAGVTYIDEEPGVNVKETLSFELSPLIKEDISIETPRLTLGFPQEPSYVSDKAERAALIRPTSVKDRVIQAEEFSKTKSFREHEQSLIKSLQQKIDRGEQVDPLQVAYFQEYLDIPEPEMQMKIEEKKKTLTKEGFKPASQVGELPAVEEGQAYVPPERPEIQLTSPLEAFKEQWKTSAYQSLSSLGGALTQMGLSTIKGTADLFKKTPMPEFIRNTIKKSTVLGQMGLYDKEGEEKLNNLLLRTTMLRKEIGNQIRKEGGMASEIAQNIADEFASSAVALSGLGALKLIGDAPTIREALKNAAKFAGITYATTEGDNIDRAKAATGAGLFMLTPIPAGRMSKNWTAKLVNTALNFGVDLFTGKIGQAFTEAKNKAIEKGEPDKWREELTTTLTPTLLLESAFGLLARAKTPQQVKQIKALYNELPPEVLDGIKKVSPQMRTEWEKAVEAETIKVEERRVSDAIEKGKIEEGDLGEYRGVDAQRTAAEAGRGDRYERGGNEPAKGYEKGDERYDETRAYDERYARGYEPERKKSEMGKEQKLREVEPKLAEQPVLPEKGVEKPSEMPLERPITEEGISGQPPAEREAEMPLTKHEQLRESSRQPLSPIGTTIKFIRFGKPTTQSMDWTENKSLQGMSVYEIGESGASKTTVRGEFSERNDVYIGTGKVVGYGSDGEPLVSNYKTRKATNEEAEKADYYGLTRKEYLDTIKESTLPPTAPTQKETTPKEGARPEVPITTTEAGAGATIFEGNKVKLGRNPQVQTIIEKLPQSDIERKNNEQFFRIKNDKTGAEQTVEAKDITQITLRPAGSQQVKEKIDLNKRLSELGLEPSVFKNKQDKMAAIKRAQAKTLEERKEEAQKGGFFRTMPASERLRDIGQTIVSKAKEYFTPSQGMSERWNDIIKEYIYKGHRDQIRSKMVGAPLTKARKDLLVKFNKTIVQDSMDSVLRGEITPDDFARKFGLGNENQIVKEIRIGLETRKDLSGKISSELKKAGKEDLSQIVKDNSDSYMTRFYERWIMGDDYVPKPEDYALAVDSVKSELANNFDKFASKIQKFTAKATPQKMIEYLESGDTSNLNISDVKDVELANNLRSRYLQIKDQVAALEVTPENLLKVEADTRALNTAAKDVIDYILQGKNGVYSKGSSPIDMNHLAQRTLGPVFRQLYGEIKEAPEVFQKTIEVQNNMLRGLELTNRIYEEGAGQWWVDMPNKSKGLTKQISGARFGKLNGKFVNSQTVRALNAAPEIQGKVLKTIIDGYNQLVRYQRVKQLVFSLPTNERNLTANYASYATANGDVLIERIFGQKASFHKNLLTAFKELKDFALVESGSERHKELLKIQEKMAELGVFHVAQSSIATDIRQGLEGITKPLGKVSQLESRMGELYAWGDYPVKRASFLTQKELGKSDTDAAKHVQRFYQHPQALPIFFRKFSKLPLADFPTFFFDSTRIKINDALYAAEQAKKGNILPLIGFTLSNAQYALTVPSVTEWLEKMFRRKDSQLPGQVDMEQMNAIKEFQPDHWQRKPIVAAYGRDDKGNVVIDYVIAANITGFPIDDTIVGVLQKQKLQEFPKELMENFIKTGMTWNQVAKYLYGQEIGFAASNYKERGMIDWALSEDPKRWKKIMDKTIDLAIESGMPIPYRNIRALKRMSKLKEEVTVGRITEADAKEQIKDMVYSEILPIKSRTITQDVAKKMISNTLYPHIQVIKDNKIVVSKGMPEKKPTPTELQEKEESQQTLNEKYALLQNYTNLAKKAFKGVLNDDVLKAILKDAGLSTDEVKMLIENKVHEIPEYKPKSKTKEYEKYKRSRE